MPALFAIAGIVVVAIIGFIVVGSNNGSAPSADSTGVSGSTTLEVTSSTDAQVATSSTDVASSTTPVSPVESTTPTPAPTPVVPTPPVRTEEKPQEPIVTPPPEVTTDDPVAEAAQAETFSQSVTYRSPAGSNELSVTLTLENNVVTNVTTSHNNGAGTKNGYQSRFEGAYADLVIGKSIDSISLSRVGGASLTSRAFNDAVAKIKAQAS